MGNGIWRMMGAASDKVSRVAMLVRHLFDNEILWTQCDKVQIAVMLRGGVGDVMIAARWLERVLTLFGDTAEIAVDIYYAIPNNIEFIFGNFSTVRYIYNDVTFQSVRGYYDFSCVINHLGYLEIDYGAHDLSALAFGDLIESWRDGVERFAPFTTRDYHPDLGHDFYALIRERGFTRQRILEAQTGIPAAVVPFDFHLPEESERSPQLHGDYITIHDGWDVQLRMGHRRPTKAYPRHRWTELVAETKARFPQILIVQLGGKTGSTIDGVDLDLKNALSMAGSAKVLQGAALHVDTDSGLVHVAASLGVPSVVMFGPTDIHYYRYPANVSLNAEGCNNCWLRTGNWAARCMLGDSVPRCMDGIEVSRVVDAIGQRLALKRASPGRHA